MGRPIFKNDDLQKIISFSGLSEIGLVHAEGKHQSQKFCYRDSKPCSGYPEKPGQNQQGQYDKHQRP